MFKCSSFRVVALCATVALPCVAAAQALPWRNDWTIQAPVSLAHTEPAAHTPMAFGPDGDILLHAAALPLDDEFVRFSNTGVVRWRANIDGDTFLSASNGAMLINADGSAYVAVLDATKLARIAADGSIAWVQDFNSTFLAATTQAVIAQGCNNIAAFDAASGQLLWQHTIGASSTCNPGGVVTDASGASYAAFSVGLGPGYAAHVLKIGADGNVQWDAQSTQPSAQIVIGTGGNLIYVTNLTGVAALASTGGGVQWSVANVRPVGVGGTPAELLVSSPNGVQRLNGANGAARWTQAAVAGNLPNDVACIGGNKAVWQKTRYDLSTGAIDWTATLPSQDNAGTWLRFFSVACAPDGTATFAGTQESSANAAPVLLRVDDSGTPSAVPIAAGRQGVWGTSIVVDAQTLVGLGTDSTPAGTTSAHVRGVDRNSGSTLWQTDIAPPNFYTTASYTYGGIAVGGGTLAVTLASGYATGTGPNCGVYVTALEPASGVVRWNTNLILSGVPEEFQLGTVSFDPLVDAQGNVIVSYETEILNYVRSTEFAQSSVVKLSAADGSILWRHDETHPVVSSADSYEIYSAPTIFLVGSDVLLGGNLQRSDDTYSGIKLSGVDGSVLWSSTVFSTPAEIYPIYSADLADDGNLLVSGNGNAKLDAQTGTTLWYDSPSPSTCTASCSHYGGRVKLPGGDVLYGAENASRAELVRVAQVPNAVPVIWQFDLQDTHLRESWIDSVDLDSNGNVWSRLVRRYGYYGEEIYYLVRFDLASGKLVTQQALSGYSYGPLIPWLAPHPLAAPEDDRLLVWTFTHAPPAPETNGAALLDTTILANGDLSLTFATDRSDTAPGQAVAFHLSVNYSGDAPISGVRLIADFPWMGLATGLACSTQSASNCVVDARGGLLASFDMQPGGRVDVTGSIVAGGGGAYVVPLSALVIGPTALNELDPSNNSSWVTVETRIFRDGFE